MRRVRSWTCALFMLVSATFASALEVPTDAEVLLTDARSRIVGVGRVVAGVRFDLMLVEGFAGPAVLVWLRPDGDVRTIEVVVAEGAVWIDGEELTSLLPEAFVEVRMWRATDLGAAWPPDVGPGAPADASGGGAAAGREPPAAVDPPGPPDVPPGPPVVGPPPVVPPSPPDVPPGPPVVPPGPPDVPPGPPVVPPGPPVVPPGPPVVPPGPPDVGPPPGEPPGPPDAGRPPDLPPGPPDVDPPDVNPPVGPPPDVPPGPPDGGPGGRP